MPLDPEDPKQLRDLMQTVHSYDPDAEQGEALRFAHIIRQFPDLVARRTPLLPSVRMADFAELGYCAYKPWHWGAGTELKRIPRVERLLVRGTDIHLKKVTKELGEAKKLPTATPKQLRDPRINISRIPELRAKIRVGRLHYLSSIERAGRTGGHLVVTEIKTGTFVFAADHFLQVWGYCLSAPGAVSRVTDGNFRARTVQWGLEYPTRGSSYGPYPFTERTLRLVRDAMNVHEKLYLAGLARVADLDRDLPGPSPKKCPPCAFSHACPWRYREPQHATLGGGDSVTDGGN